MSFEDYVTCVCYERALLGSPDDEMVGHKLYTDSYLSDAKNYMESIDSIETDDSFSTVIKQIIRSEYSHTITDQTEIREYALYTGNDFNVQYDRLNEMVSAGMALPDNGNLSFADVENEAKAAIVFENGKFQCLLLMEKGNGGYWKCLESFAAEKIEDKIDRYTFRTGNKQIAFYYSDYLSKELYFFDDSAENCLVMDRHGNFYCSEDMVNSWYFFWKERIGNQPYSSNSTSKLGYDLFLTANLEIVHPKIWIEILFVVCTVAVIIGLFVFGAWFYRRSQKDSVAWLERIPLAYRMLSGVPRYRINNEAPKSCREFSGRIFCIRFDFSGKVVPKLACGLK